MAYEASGEVMLSICQSVCLSEGSSPTASWDRTLFPPLLVPFYHGIGSYPPTPTLGHGFNLSVSLSIRGVQSSSVEVRVLCQGGGGKGGKSPLIELECKMADRKQPPDWTIIQDGGPACDWTRIQDGRWKSSHLIGQ